MWTDVFLGFGNGLTTWVVFVVHLFGGWDQLPVYNAALSGNWCDFGFLLGTGSPFLGRWVAGRAHRVSGEPASMAVGAFLAALALAGSALATGASDADRDGSPAVMKLVGMDRVYFADWLASIADTATRTTESPQEAGQASSSPVPRTACLAAHRAPKVPRRTAGAGDGGRQHPLHPSCGQCPGRRVVPPLAVQ